MATVISPNERNQFTVPDDKLPEYLEQGYTQPALGSGDLDDYASLRTAVLQGLIAERNESRETPLSTEGRKADLIRTLRADDVAEVDYSTLTVARLTALIGERNAGREDAALISADGRKADLVAALQADDAAAAE